MITKKEELQKAYQTAYFRYNKMREMQQRISFAAYEVVCDMNKEQGKDHTEAKNFCKGIYWKTYDIYEPGVKKAFDASEKIREEYFACEDHNDYCTSDDEDEDDYYGDDDDDPPE